MYVGGQLRQNDSSSISITTETATWPTPTMTTTSFAFDETSVNVDLGELTVTSPEAISDTNNGAVVVIGQLAEGWSPVLYRLLIEPIFEASVSNGSVSISVEEDAPNSEPGAMPMPIVLDVNNITILEANGKYFSLVDIGDCLS